MVCPTLSKFELTHLQHFGSNLEDSFCNPAAQNISPTWACLPMMFRKSGACCLKPRRQMSQELAPQFSKFERTHLKFWVQLGSFVLSPHRVCLALCAACFSITILTDPKHFQHLQFVLSSTLMAALAMVLRSCACHLKPRQPNSHNGLPKTFKAEGATCNVLGPTWKIVLHPCCPEDVFQLV